MKKQLVFMILLLCSLVLCQAAGAEKVSDPASLFVKANELYQTGDYEAARDLYTEILSLGVQNGQVYYNLGNTYFRLGMTGRSIQHYLLAREFTPREEDLEANLGYAREETEDRLVSDSSARIFGELFFWYHRMSVKEMIYVFLICNLLFWSALCVRLFTKRPALIWVVSLSLFFGLTMGGTAAVRMIYTHLHKPAVIVVPQVSVQSGMDPKSTVLFELHDGAEVVIDRVHDDWRLIRIPSGKKGWVRKDQVGSASL